MAKKRKSLKKAKAGSPELGNRPEAKFYLNDRMVYGPLNRGEIDLLNSLFPGLIKNTKIFWYLFEEDLESARLEARTKKIK